MCGTMLCCAARYVTLPSSLLMALVTLSHIESNSAALRGCSSIGQRVSGERAAQGSVMQCRAVSSVDCRLMKMLLRERYRRNV